MKGIQPINFLLMANTIKYKNKVGLKTYDLKGSLVNRRVQKGENQTLKDQNMLICKKYRLNNQIKGILQFKNGRKGNDNDIKRIREILERDAHFLKECKLLDYSVLLSIEKKHSNSTNLAPFMSLGTGRSKKLSENRSMFQKSKTSVYVRPEFEIAEKRHQFDSQCGRYIYHIAIIDYLTEYNLQKKMENWFKTTILKRDSQMISAVKPDFYAPRFLSFMQRQVFVNEQENIVFTSKKIKDREHGKMLDAFQNQYHQYYLCCHCGRTYNDISDGRVTQVYKAIRQMRGDTVATERIEEEEEEEDLMKN